MRLIWLLFVSVLATLSAALDFSGLPDCAIDCIGPLLLQHHCDLLNTTAIQNCLCAEPKVQAPISKCVRTKCNFTEELAAKKKQDVTCAGFKIPTRQPQIIAISIAWMVAVIIFVALRLWSRYTVLNKFWWDDWVLLAAASCLIALQGLSIWGAVIGFGLHIWNVNPFHGTALYKFLWIYELLYTTVQLLSKTSVLLLYWRIFPQQWLRHAIIVIATIVMLQGALFFLILVFLCDPIALNYDKSLSGKCLDLNAVILAGTVICFVEDVVIWFLPIPSILMLRLKLGRKLAVIGIMGVGIIAVIASTIRLKYVVNFVLSIDQNWDDYGIAILSYTELSLSIICICFPPIKPLLNKWFPRHFGSYNQDPNPSFSFHLRNDTNSPAHQVVAVPETRRPERGFLGGILTRLSLTETGWGLSRFSARSIESGGKSENKSSNGNTIVWLDTKSSGGGHHKNGDIEMGSRSTGSDRTKETGETLVP